MEALKVYISEKTAEKFRKNAMKKYKYKKGALSKAAEVAFETWIKAQENAKKR